MRAILVDWLVQVHSKFRLLQETLYMCIAVMDRFLQVSVASGTLYQWLTVIAFMQHQRVITWKKRSKATL